MINCRIYQGSYKFESFSSIENVVVHELRVYARVSIFHTWKNGSKTALRTTVFFLWCQNRRQCEPGHKKMCLLSYANNKGADQPAHPRRVISAFIIRCLDSIISLDSTSEISSL